MAMSSEARHLNETDHVAPARQLQIRAPGTIPAPGLERRLSRRLGKNHCWFDTSDDILGE